MISKDEVKHIAKLARLELTENEVVKMQKDLSAILDYFRLLAKANTRISADKNADLRGYKKQSNVLRKDEAVAKPASLANNLVAQAPDKKEGYIKVKAIL